MTKKANKGIFCILKSVIDSKVPALRVMNEKAAPAQKEVNKLCQHIESLQQYIMINRHDREEVNDAQDDIEKYKNRILDLVPVIEKGADAKLQLQAADKFNAFYHNEIVMPACYNKEMAALQAQYKIAENAVIEMECLFESQRNLVADMVMDEVESPEYSILEQYQEELIRRQRILSNISGMIRNMKR